MKSLDEILDAACAEGREWASGKTLPKIWAQCERGDWLIWLLRESGAEVTQAQWVRVAVAAAERALIYVPKGENRPRVAVESAKAWLDNPCKKTANYAYWAFAAAYDAADALDNYGAYNAAATTARASAAACAVVASSARISTVFAFSRAADAAYYNAGEAAYDVERKRQADDIRAIIPCPWGAQ